ncbi:thioredoxin domain-containing protein [Nocardioides koreensis]|uniref:Thioredoxin domain-containing protein n=1 Tax=Nocardioides koreensis TaxID=433651 RepID=A0ABP5LF43_9ACTN
MSDRRKSPAIPLVVAVVAAIITAGMLVNSWGSDQSPDESAPAPAPTADSSSTDSDDPFADIVRRDEGDPLAKGPADAPVVMIAYSDFQCPYCGKFARDTEPVLDQKYVDDGTLRIEWRDFPYLGKESDLAARAGRAAAIQGKFWAFHDAMYEHQLPPNSGHLDVDHLVGVAQDLGLDPDRFRNDIDADETRFAVGRDFEEGRRIGVTGTPAFIINGKPVMGAQPTEVFESIIEKAAAEAGR